MARTINEQIENHKSALHHVVDVRANDLYVPCSRGQTLYRVLTSNRVLESAKEAGCLGGSRHAATACALGKCATRSIGIALLF